MNTHQPLTRAKRIVLLRRALRLAHDVYAAEMPGPMPSCREVLQTTYLDEFGRVRDEEDVRSLCNAAGRVLRVLRAIKAYKLYGHTTEDELSRAINRLEQALEDL